MSSTVDVGQVWQDYDGADDAKEETGADEAYLCLGLTEQVQFVNPIVKVFRICCDRSVFVSRYLICTNLLLTAFEPLLLSAER